MPKTFIQRLDDILESHCQEAHPSFPNCQQKLDIEQAVRELIERAKPERKIRHFMEEFVGLTPEMKSALRDSNISGGAFNRALDEYHTNLLMELTPSDTQPQREPRHGSDQ